MTLRRILATTLASTLVATATALVSGTAPAAAGTTTETKIVSGSSGPWIYQSGSKTQPGAPAVGDTLSFAIEVETSDGGSVSDGTVTVKRRLAGSKKWQTVASADTPYLYDSVKAVRNASYRAVYNGAGGYQDTDATRAVKVQKKLKITPKSGRRLGLAGKIFPQGKNKVVVLKKQGKHWKKYRVVKSNRKGRFFAKLVAPHKRGAKILWKLQIKGSKKFAPTKSGTYYTTRY